MSQELEIGKKEQSIIYSKSHSFAIKAIKEYRFLVEAKKEYVLSKQLLKSATSIGANVNEAISSESKKDFVHKLSISLKEARETKYWLSLLHQSDFISSDSFKTLNSECSELIKILSSIILTTKQRYLS